MSERIADVSQHTDRRSRKVDHDAVIARYQELRSLAETGRELGISRERVRQIVNRAGISTAKVREPRPDRFCKECGALVTEKRAEYCEEHRTPQARARRAFLRLKADPARFAHWQAVQAKNKRERRERKKDEFLEYERQYYREHRQRMLEQSKERMRRWRERNAGALQGNKAVLGESLRGDV